MTRRMGGPARCLLITLSALGLLLTIPAPALSTLRRASPDQPAAAEPCEQRPAAGSDGAPVLAHFYIWFTPSSWNRAKIDYPAIGRYSSDEMSVMAEQVAQAQAAGIDGFMVGWRSTAVLNRRLAALRDVAAEYDFSLAVTYQAQDFNRDPLPVPQVRRDLEELAATYADDPVFHVLGSRPVVALSGTWHYSAEELRSIVEPVAARLQVLATEKNLEGYERVADLVDGELYYWSSADPEKTPNYRAKLQEMAAAVHDRCGIWVAPVAPGFDARLVGGSSVVDRRDGDTLRSSWAAATATAPELIGVISWNEFSENTHVEPSTTYGAHYLEVLAELTGAPPPAFDDLDSSGPQGAASPLQSVLTLSVVLGTLLVVGLLGTRRRRARAAR